MTLSIHPTSDLLWGYLIHLSYNMWSDRDAPERGLTHYSYRPYLRFDETLWRELLPKLIAAGANAVVLDLGDGVRYESHPEIAVEGAWSTQRLREELAALRALGLEPLPKLNFSTSHDAWLGPYARCISTPLYYQVCQDLIAEVLELFDWPRLFHIGMDEETARHQRYHAYAVIRQYDLWWQDLAFYVGEVEKSGVRAWVWSDYYWEHGPEYAQRMPRSVLQSNWYYRADFGPEVREAQTYVELEAHGYDQIPTGSTWSADDNLERTVRFCRQHISAEHLLGFLQTVWRPTLLDCRDRHEAAIEALRRAHEAWTRGD